jgi:N6-L-threonylcarbamoyladenine synthase
LQKSGLAPLAHPEDEPSQELLDLVASLRHAIVRELLRRVSRAVESECPRALVVAGGVAANRLLRREATRLADEAGLALSIPAMRYCGDNAAMIGLAGLPALRRGEDHREDLDAAAAMTLGGPEAERKSHRHRG